MDYKNGTYVGQVDASDEVTACRKWAESLNVEQISGLGIKSREVLIKELRRETPILLEGLINAWCVTALIRGKLAVINIVKTEISTNGQRPMDN